ncbi:hypothetical protein SDC9_193289 [bioreactor metagenome]|uniref:DGC domain-containing protein n=1 Tax=bioreactor metagenome TaxID=1076179 RepID=A0A645I5P0_9ZZZZ
MACCTDGKRSITRIVYTCSGCCAEGKASDLVGRKLREEGYARCGHSCLAGIGAGYPRFLKAAQEASEVIVIDGCKMVCAKTMLKKANITATSYILLDMGFSEERDQDTFVTAICQQIMR